MVVQNPASRSVLRIGGAFTAVFSLVMGLLVLFVIPGACTFVSGIQLIILGFLFVVGVIFFFLGNTLSRKLSRKKISVETNPQSGPKDNG